MNHNLKKTVGQRLQLLRLDQNLTQEQMAEKLNLSTSAYCKIEYGETDLTLTRLSQIAEVLKMSVIDLFCKIEGESNPYDHKGYPSNHALQEGSASFSDSANDLRDLIKANSKLIDLLSKRIEVLEKRVE